MLSITAAASAVSEEPVSVGLENPTDSFGIRSASTGTIIKRSGVPLIEYSTDRWNLESVDPYPGELYEYWLKFQKGADAYYIPSYGCSLASTDPVSSVSESDNTDYSIQLKREQTPVESFGAQRGDSVRLRLTVTDYEGLDPNVFGHLDRDAGKDFCFVASPVDPSVYPALTPNLEQDPPFYLLSQIDVIVPTPDIADELYDNVVQELGVLIDAYRRHDTLSSESTTTIE